MNHIVLIPTYNERKNIQTLLPRLFTALPDIHVMVIDDNSPDGTAVAVTELQSRYPHLLLHKRDKKQGLGSAYMDGFRRVLADPSFSTISMMDADLSHSPEALPHLLNATRHADYVIGSRYISNGTIIGWELWRKCLSACGNIYCRWITRLPIKDCTSGFASIRTDILRRMDFNDFDTSGYAFLMYLKYKAWKMGATFFEVPIQFKNRVSGESKISSSIIKEGVLLPWRLLAKQRRPSTPCPICQGSSSYWFSKNACDLYRCSACHLRFVHPLPARTDAVYTEDYFCGAHKGFGYVHYDTDKQSDARTFFKYLDYINQYTPTKGILLDVGAATGAFLEKAKERGWHATGVEISAYAAEAARKKGLEVHTGTIEHVNLPLHTYSVITLWDVFEHVTDPHQTLDRLSTLLDTNGLLVINTPDAGSLYARLIGRRWPLIIPPEHLHLFNHRNLTTLLHYHGFDVLMKTKIGKSFLPAYIFQILYTTSHNRLWKWASDIVRRSPLNRIPIPIHMRDNMFLIARKRAPSTPSEPDRQ